MYSSNHQIRRFHFLFVYLIVLIYIYTAFSEGSYVGLCLQHLIIKISISFPLKLVLCCTSYKVSTFSSICFY